MYGGAAVVGVSVCRCVTAAELTFAAFCVSAVFSESSAIFVSCPVQQQELEIKWN